MTRRRRNSLIASALVASVLAIGPSAWALTQPGSATLIPVLNPNDTCADQGNVQACLDEQEGARTVEAQADAAITPGTFDPRCNLTFHVIERGASYSDVFGWYNVQRDATGVSIKPALEDLHTFILGQENPPFTRELAVRDDPNYLGGEIGFFIATGYPTAVVGGPPTGAYDIFYTELAHNANQPGADAPSIHDIIWQSVTFDDSFYFGWEDLLSGNDNDFDDMFTRVSGIQCAGGGAACETGLLGVCRDGTMQCQQGDLACVPNIAPSAESCNALDDDCNGMTDDGDLCEPEHICDRGKCVPTCNTGEFRCRAPLVCNDAGACVDPLCVDHECPEGQICEAGACIDGCALVTCPYGNVCRVGSCVDPCANVSCDDGYSCHLGVCSDCDCTGCGGGQTCSNDACVEDACVGVLCAPGNHCAAGACVDDCAGVVCPGGAACAGGLCTQPAASGSSGGAAGSNSGGTGILIDNGSASAGGSRGAGEEGADPETVERRPPIKPGCACRAAGSGNSVLAFCLGALAISGLGARRGTRGRNRSGAPRLLT